jgi:8-oxo-dGTP pyrophosphatase MutT (NUDIX family)
MPLRDPMDGLKQQIRTSLAKHSKSVASEETFTPSAVLIPIFYKNGEPHLLLTLRTETVASHKGQISFPGGTRENGDRDLLATALRETFEEVGIRPEDVEVLGELDDLLAVTNFVVTPFVGVFPYPYDFKISHDEIAELIEIPLSFFMDPRNRRVEERLYRGRNVTVYFYDYGKYTVWGVTARILKDFVDFCIPSEQS